MKKTLGVGILIITLYLFAGPLCALAADKRTIAVADFTNNAGYGGPFRIEQVANDVFSLFLLDTGKFRVLERSKMDSLVRELNLNKTEMIDTKKAVKIGKQLGAQYIATGSITEMGEEEKAFSGYSVETRNITYRVAIEVRIIDTERGEIIFGDMTSDSITVRQTRNINQSQGNDAYKRLLKSALSKSVSKLMGSFTGQPQGKGSHAVTIESSPEGAEIEVDGTSMGHTPRKVTLSSGEHSIRIYKSGYRYWERSMEISKGMFIKANLAGEGFNQK